MTDEAPTQQGKLSALKGAQSRALAAGMILDLVHQTMASAPPRTWVQSAQHPGSRRWMTATLSAAAQALDLSLPLMTRQVRRAAAVSILERSVQQMNAADSWGTASADLRGWLADRIDAEGPAFPFTAARIARDGTMPFSSREQTRLQRRAAIHGVAAASSAS